MQNLRVIFILYFDFQICELLLQILFCRYSSLITTNKKSPHLRSIERCSWSHYSRQRSIENFLWKEEFD